MDITEPFTSTVSYCLPARPQDPSSAPESPIQPLGIPPLSERLTWDIPAPQRRFEETFLTGDTGLLTTLHTPPQSLFQFPYWKVRDIAEMRARQLRTEDKHHQAYALEWVAHTALSLSHALYDIGEILGWNGTKQARDLNRSQTAVLLFRDGDNSFVVDTVPDGRIYPRASHLTPPPYPDWVITIDVITQHAHELFTGAVLLDYLTLTNGDKEAAAVMSSLDSYDR